MDVHNVQKNKFLCSGTILGLIRGNGIWIPLFYTSIHECICDESASLCSDAIIGIAHKNKSKRIVHISD